MRKRDFLVKHRRHLLWLAGDKKKGQRLILRGETLRGFEFGNSLTQINNLGGAIFRNCKFIDCVLDTINLGQFVRCEFLGPNTQFKLLTVKEDTFKNCKLNSSCFDFCDFIGVDMSTILPKTTFYQFNQLFRNRGNKFWNCWHPKQAVKVKGAFTGYKAVRGGYVLKLKVAKDTPRTSNINGENKCRVKEALVVECVYKHPNTHTPGKTFFSDYSPNFKYTIGEKVVATNYDPTMTDTCAGGIHLFKTKREAIEYGQNQLCSWPSTYND